MKKKGKLKKPSNKMVISSISGIVGFILTIFLGDLSSRNAGEVIQFNPLEIIQLFALSLQISVSFPKGIAIFIGTILLFVPGILFYLLAKDIYEHLKK